LKRIYFTVTNDLSYDQRMHRICHSLATHGFEVILVGRQRKTSLPLQQKSFLQKRLHCFFDRGILFYAEYNLRLFLYLITRKMDGVCAIDLDTVIPCLLAAALKGVPRIYDGHEFFTEMKEVRTRPVIQRSWLAIERWTLPRFRFGYTVSQSLADEFNRRYHTNFTVVRNLPLLRPLDELEKKEKFLLAQGAVNEGRAFEYLIPAMKYLDIKLKVCGDGNFMEQLKELIRVHGVATKVELTGMLLPEQLWPITQSATLGLGLADREGIHQFLALPNKFFDYIHAGLPQLAMAYPEYEKINRKYKVAVLTDSLDPEAIAHTISIILQDDALLQELHMNCLRARAVYCWQEEEKILIAYYKNIFHLA
jgi:glycosyltransferase involved in cell wall biosynthesis